MIMEMSYNVRWLNRRQSYNDVSLIMLQVYRHSYIRFGYTARLKSLNQNVQLQLNHAASVIDLKNNIFVR